MSLGVSNLKNQGQFISSGFLNKLLNFQYLQWIFCGPLDLEDDCTYTLQDSYHYGSSEISWATKCPTDNLL